MAVIVAVMEYRDVTIIVAEVKVVELKVALVVEMVVLGTVTN